MNAFEFVLILVAMAIGAGLLSTVVRTVARVFERRPAVARDPDVRGLAGEVESLRAQLAEQDDLRRRVEELEERVDFTERMLAQRQERSRLPGPGGAAGAG
jgi:hypothetical protein